MRPRNRPTHSRSSRVPKLGPAAAAARENGIAKAVMDVQGHAVAEQRRHHRNFLRRQFAGKCVLFANGGVGPAARAVELGDHGRAVLDPDLVDPVFIAVERQYPAVAAMSHRLDRVQDGLRRELGIRCYRSTFDEFYRYDAVTPLGESRC